MKLKNKKLWEECVNNNTDEYSKCCVDVARKVMEILDEDETPLQPGYSPDLNTTHGIICKANAAIDEGSITGFMAGCVANMVSECHVRGEEFRKAWNGDYNYDGDGVVNPAVITIEGGDNGN